MFRTSGNVNSQTGQPDIGATATGAGTRQYDQRQTVVPWSPEVTVSPYAHRSPEDASGFEWLQRGWPTPEGPGQATPRRDVKQGSGLPAFVQTPYYDGGAQMFAPQFETPFVNPIGGGVQVPYGNHASYYGSGQYEQGVVFWTNQFIPTSIASSGLATPQEMAAILSDFQVLQSIEVAP